MMRVRLAYLVIPLLWLTAFADAPPAGFQLVTAAPSYLLRPDQFAPKMMMTVDGNGDPAFAYLILDANNDRDTSSAEVDVVSWDRAAGRWNPPARVDIVGEVNINGNRRGFSLAIDPGNHRFGMAYMVGLRELRLAWSDDRGRTWTRHTVEHDSQRTFEEPALALDHGRAYLAYRDSRDGLRYRAGAQDEAPQRWKFEAMSTAPAAKRSRTGASGIADAHVSAVLNKSPHQDARDVQAAFGAGDKMLVAYVSPTATKNGAGIVLWREP